MLTISACVVGDTLTVTGDSGANNIAIYYSYFDNIQVVGDGGFNYVHALSGIHNIVVNADGGDDYINLAGNQKISDPEYYEEYIFPDITSVVINGGDGNDLIRGSDLDDEIHGGAGTDTIDGAGGDDTIYGDDGADNLYGSEGNDTIYGGAGNDAIYGDAHSDYSYDHLSPDFPDGTPWQTTGPLEGTGPFYDISGPYDVAAGNDSLYGGDGNDTLVGDRNGTDSTLYQFRLLHDGNDWEDTYWADISDFDQLTFHDGNDQLDGGAGNDTLQGEGGNDTYTFSASSAGEDSVTEAANVDDHDTLDFSAFTTSVSIDLSSTAQQTYNSTNKLTLSSGTGIEDAKGGSAADTITGNSRDNSLYGNQGSDSLTGGDGNDSLYGSYQDDSLMGGNGNDLLDGGSDSDTLLGGDGCDTLLGGDGQDYLYGEAGNDVINGGGDNDNVLNGGTGSDTYVFAPNDATTGETVVDYSAAAQPSDVNTLDFSAFTSAISIDLRSTSQQTVGTGLKLTLSDGTAFSNVVGGSGNDTIVGNDRNNTLTGGDGNDTLYGGQGNDTLYGGNGNDNLFGDAMPDYGDRLTGPPEGDVLWPVGGPAPDGGTDTYWYPDPYYDINVQGGNDSLYGGAGDDYIAGDYNGQTLLYKHLGGTNMDSNEDDGNGGTVVVQFWVEIYQKSNLLQGTDTIDGGSGSNTTIE